MKNNKREFLVLVTPVRDAVDEFMSQHPGWRVEDVIWIKNTSDLYRLRGLELKWGNVHFLHRAYEIENVEEEIMVRVRDYPINKEEK